MRILVLVVSFLLSLGCTKGDPGFSVLDSNAVPQPLFNGQPNKIFTAQTKTDNVAVSGECDFKIRGITAQVVGVDSAPGPLLNIVNSSLNVKCQDDGKFSFSLKTLSDLGFTPVMGNTYEILLRAQTSAGVSRASSLKVYLANIGGTSHAAVTSGGTLSGTGERSVASTHFKAVLRVDHRISNFGSPGVAGAMTTQTSSAGTFRAKMGVAADAD